MIDHVKELWREYRCGKMYPAIGELLDDLKFHKPNEKVNKRAPYSTGETLQVLPRAGSVYWTMQIDPPEWFYKEMRHEDVSAMFAIAAPPKTKRKKIKIRKM